MLLHRCRYVQYHPSAIATFAISPNLKYTAIVKEYGEIEICISDADLTPVHRFFIQKWEESPIRSVIWSSSLDDTLIVGDLSGAISVWDVWTGVCKNRTDGFGGSIWKLKEDRSEGLIACACEDGTVRLWEFRHGNLLYKRACDRQKGRVLDVCWSGSTIVTVSSVGLLCTFDSESGRNLKRIFVEPGSVEDFVVWCVDVLADGELAITGDCRGNVRVFCLATGTCVQSITTHKADILALAIDRERNEIFVSGVDNRTIRLSCSDNTWKVTGSVRLHTHDVHSLVLHPAIPVRQPNSQLVVRPQLLSGGVDATLAVIDYCRRFDGGGYGCRVKFPFPVGNSVVVVCSEAGLIAGNLRNCIRIWRVSTCDQLVEVACKESICSFAISPNGERLVIAHSGGKSVLYEISYQDGAVRAVHRRSDVDWLPFSSSISISSDLIAFLCYPDRDVKVFDAATGKLYSRLNPYEGENASLSTFAFSGCKSFVAVASIQGELECFRMEKKGFSRIGDKIRFDGVIRFLAFLSPLPLLFVALSGNRFCVLDAGSGNFCGWAAPGADLPQEWLSLRDSLSGVSLLSGHSSESLPLLLWGSEFICRVDLKKPIAGDFKNFSMTKKFKPLIGAGILHDPNSGDDQLVVVERPWLEVLNSMPVPFERKRFGHK